MLLYMQLYITRRALPYQNGSKKCNLYLEKIGILQGNPVNTLNQRTKIVSKCRHKAN